jgi:endonuclease YncB( thermonuclease family)
MTDLPARPAFALGCLLVMQAGAAMAGPELQPGDRISGQAEIIDARSLSVAGTTIVLWEMDAPARAQRCLRNDLPWECGEAAANHLEDIVRDGELECEIKQPAADGEPPSARCYLGYSDIAAALIDRGYATALEVWKSPYKQNHRESRGANRGIFSGLFMPPAQWREGRRMPGLEAD